MDASGAIGMYVEDTPFRWMADATTALSVVDATGSVENMSADATTQVNAGNNAHIT